jgi:hypothetical protein
MPPPSKPKPPTPLQSAANEILAAIGALRLEVQEESRSFRRELGKLADRIDALERRKGAA